MRQNFFLEGELKQWKLFEANRCKIWLAGTNRKKNFQKVLNIIGSSKKIDKKKIKRIISALGEHFGIIIFSKLYTFAAVDYTRGYPIFWKFENNVLVLSAQATLIKNKILNFEQLTAFRMSGYTTGTETLWSNIKGLIAGSYILLEEKNKLSFQRYFSYIPKENIKLKYNFLQKTLVQEITKLIKKLIIDANGTNIVIPLSAGLDSRLIASGLKEYNYTNVKCFSYGLKNNYEAIASKKISKALGFDWMFIEINQKIIKKFYKSKIYKDYLKLSADGVSTSTIQGLYAIYQLKKINYISNNSLIVNGNSGDFISGGHIPPDIKPLNVKSNFSSKDFDKILLNHIEKHYSLWNNLKTKDNIKIIQNKLKSQCEKILNYKKKINPHTILELLEYENRQTKYVVNSQRIYDNFQLNWTLPLWNKSFIKFWENVPLKYKLNQKLYKDTLSLLNLGGVWTNEFAFKLYVSPKTMRIIRFLFKGLFLFIGKKEWHNFEKKFINYWTENILGFSSISYIEYITNKNTPRNYVSFYTLLAEKNNLGSHWQEKRLNTR